MQAMNGIENQRLIDATGGITLANEKQKHLRRETEVMLCIKPWPTGPK